MTNLGNACYRTMDSHWKYEVKITLLVPTWPNMLRAFSMRLDKHMENTWFSPYFNQAKTMRFSCVHPSHGKRTWHIWPCIRIIFISDSPAAVSQSECFVVIQPGCMFYSRVNWMAALYLGWLQIMLDGCSICWTASVCCTMWKI